MELKLYCSAKLALKTFGFNRTFMELKLRKSFTSTFVITVLIGPSWN